MAKSYAAAKRKKKSPTLSALEKKLDTLVSTYVRKSAADEFGAVRCVTCRKFMNWEKDGAQAGHFVKRQHRATRWDLRNINVQCIRCNHHLGGNEAEHGAYIIRKYGLQVHEELLSLKHRVVKVTRESLERMIEDYERKLADLDMRKAA